jgi:hypothetical protein
VLDIVVAALRLAPSLFEPLAQTRKRRAAELPPGGVSRSLPNFGIERLRQG